MITRQEQQAHSIREFMRGGRKHVQFTDLSAQVPERVRVYSILRLMLPDTLIPSTTALSTLAPGGRLEGILAGANVIMPNFTPRPYRQAYSLYRGKPDTDGAEALRELRKELSAAGYTIYPKPQEGRL